MSTDLPDGISRRSFVDRIARTGAALSVVPLGGPLIIPRRLLGGPGYMAPSRTLNVACIGIGGMGMNNMLEVLKAGDNVVAVCDADFPFVERGLAGRLRARATVPAGQEADEAARLADGARLRDAYAKAAKYADFREMLDKQKDIEAVLIATPDHLHAVMAHRAMKAGKHVYVQKPLTYSVYESRLLARTARETGVVTQMGNQGHSLEGTRRINEIIAAGIIGPVREVHVWTDRPQRYWAQGIPRPGSGAPASVPTPVSPTGTATSTTPAAPVTSPVHPRWSIRTVDNAILRAMADNPQSPPPGFDWNLFLGPAKDRPYHPSYHPFSWRGWVDFGVSAIGDMGAHLMDQPYWALGLRYPTSIIATSTPWGSPANNPASYPLAMTARYEFAARGRGQPAVTMYWYDGGLMPMLSNDIPLPTGDGGGGIFIGEKGFLTYETYGNNPTVYPTALAVKAARVPKTMPRVTTTHEANWTAACKGEAQASAPFEYAARLTEVMLLGVAALRTGQGKRLLYDGDAMRVTNLPDANQYLTREYRAGWEL